MNLRALAGRAIRLALRPLGYGIVPLDQLEVAHSPLTRAVRELGIELVIDVGANAGMTGVKLRNSGFSGRIVSFEPQAAVFKELQAAAAGDALWDCRRIALGEASGELPMYISDFTPGNSLLQKSLSEIGGRATPETVRTETVPVRTLDDLAAEMDLTSHKALLKIDVQGYEMQVLRGATRVLQTVKAAFVELLFIQGYEGQARYSDVIDSFIAAGFHFAGLYEEIPPTRVARQTPWADAIFIRPEF